MTRRRIICVVIAAFAMVFASLYIFNTGDEPLTQATVEVNKNEVVVYVSGQVKTPAVITLEDNGNLRFIDAVNAAGGVTDLADTEVVNLAEPLNDGQHIHIPAKDIIFREIPAQSSAKNSDGLTNINTADEKELQKIKGVGPAIAGRIIEYRNNNGAFKSVDEIKKVRGIGDKTFEKMKDFITV